MILLILIREWLFNTGGGEGVDGKIEGWLNYFWSKEGVEFFSDPEERLNKNSCLTGKHKCYKKGCFHEKQLNMCIYIKFELKGGGYFFLHTQGVGVHFSDCMTEWFEFFWFANKYGKNNMH